MSKENVKLNPKNKIDFVTLWNNRCGKISDLTGEDLFDAMANQSERLDEEFTETAEAMANKDQVEILDGIVDVDVVLAGLCMIGGVFDEDAYNHKMDMAMLITITAVEHDDVTPQLYWDLMYHYTNLLGEALAHLKSAIVNQHTLEDITNHVTTAYAMLTILEEFCGHDIDGAFKAIMDNNDEKWSTSADFVAPLAGQLIMETGEEHSVLMSEIDGEVTYSIHRDSDDKIVKFPGHPKVSIDGFLSKLEKTLQMTYIADLTN